MTRRFWIDLALTAPALVVEMGCHSLSGAPSSFPERVPAWVQLPLATPVELWGGWLFFATGCRSRLVLHVHSAPGIKMTTLR